MIREMEGIEDVVIAGGGIAGLALALALKRIGIRALVLERSKELRAYGAALTLASNAMLALDALGVSHKILSKYTPIEKGRFTNIENGATQEIKFPTKNGTLDGPRVVHRKLLLEALAEELPTDRVRFSSKLTSIKTQTHDQHSSIVVIHLEDGATIKTKVLVGCDGVNSVVAQWLGLSEPVSSGRAAMRSLAVFPEGHGFDQVQQFIGDGKRGGFVPLNDKELYCFLVYKSLPKEKEAIANDPKLIQKEIIENYAKDFPTTYHDVVLHSDLSTLTWATLKYRRPWDVILGKFNKGAITVAGDAMHPTTPDLGQGGCVALEDAIVLARHIGESYIKNGNQVIPGEMTRAIEGYVKERRWRAAWLITASYLSGWSQQRGSGWFNKFFRDVIFYKFIYPKILTIADYDCGKLPEASHLDGAMENSKKID